MAADVHVTTWDELRSAVNNATEETNIYLDNDIDLNDEHPEGVSAVALSSDATFSVYVYGQEHHIRNILMDGNIAVFKGRYVSSGDTYYWLAFFNVNFDNVQIQSTGTVGKFLGDAVQIRRCSISITLSANSNSIAVGNDQLATSRVYINRSAITITGANSIQNPCVTIGGEYYCDFNNIKLLGFFKRITLKLVRNSIITGDFKQTYTSGTPFELRLTACTINAKIDMAVLPSCTNTSITVINTDDLTLPSGKTLDNLSSFLTQVTTEELKRVPDLSDEGFPIR
jgi:hypothetical protein